MMANRVLSGVMGLSVADALGVPVEFVDRQTLAQDPVVGMREYGTYHQPAGTWSDDTSMTLCLVDSLSKGLDYHDIMKKFSQWYKTGDYTPFNHAFDVGITTSEALKQFEGGTSPLKCGGTAEYDNGNGSLMRILPILFYLESTNGMNFNNDQAYKIIHNISALTHAHKRSQIACGIYISIASTLHRDNDLESKVRQGMDQAMNYYKSQKDFVEELVHFKNVDKKSFAQFPEAIIKSSGYVVDTLEAAIWCLLNTNSYEDCVLQAVNLGEDTDTVAAVAGGLAGLHYGYESIPEQWLARIAKREWMEGLCNQLYLSYV